MTWEGLTPPYATIVADPPWPYDDKPTGYQRGETGGRPKAAFLPYSRMTVDEIAGLPISDLAAPGAHLYLWTTQRFIWYARHVAEEWGWRPLKVLTWCKEPMGRGMGGSFANTTEFILFCRRPVGDLIRSARQQLGMERAILHGLIRGGQPTGIVYRWEQDDCYPSGLDWWRLREVLPGLRELPDIVADPNPVDTTWWQWKRGPHSAKPAAFLDLVEQVSPAPRVELFARAQRLGWDSWGWGYEGAAS